MGAVLVLLVLSLGVIAASAASGGDMLAGSMHRALLARDYFAAREVQLVSLFTCSVAETLLLVKTLQMAPSPMRWSVGVGQLGQALGHSGVYANLSCEAGLRAIATLGAGNTASWLVWSSAESGLAELAALKLAEDADLMWVREDDLGAELLDLFKHDTDPSSALFSFPAGRWSADQGLRLSLSRAESVARRGDLMGATIQVAVVLHQMEVEGGQESLRLALEDHANSHKDSETRFGYALATHLAEMYNFSMNMLTTPSWGYAQLNGTFDGMIGMLQRGEIKLGITPAVITAERLSVADFTVQTWTLRTCFIFRHPRLLVPYKALVEPFRVSTWLVVVLVATLATLVLWGVRTRESLPAYVGQVLGEALVAVIGLLSQQGCSVDSKLVSGRVVLLSGLVLAIMLQSFYTSAIVTALLTPIPRTIRTAHDLARSPLRLGLEDYSYNRAVFPNSKDPLTSSLYRDKILAAFPAGGFFSVSDGVGRVRRGGFAFYSEDSSLYKPIQDTFSDDEKCSLSEVELNPAFITAAPVAKASPHRELFNRGLLMMMERGLRSRQRRQWSAQRPACAGEANVVAAVGLDPIFPAHALLLLGHVLAVIALLLERRHASRRARGPGRLNAVREVKERKLP